MDLYKWSLHMSARQSRLLPVLEDLAEKLEPEHGITVRNMRRRDFQGEVERFMDVYNKAWERTGASCRSRRTSCAPTRRT